MSIVHFVEELKGVPDLHTLKMKYEDGGKIEVWFTASKTARVPCGSSPKQIRAAFEEGGQ